MTMASNHNKLLCRYQYDPLDRLVDCTLSGQESARRFYQKDRLVTELGGAVQHSFMQHADQLMAQQQRKTDTVETSLLFTDQQRSVLNIFDASTSRSISHTPYGHRPLASGLLSLLGFNGERPDPVTGRYLLGNGYRAFNPVLMRFNSPDSWSPFGKGGLNAYAYCVGDPVNRRDPTGHTPAWLKAALRSAGLMRDRTRPLVSASSVSTGPFRNPMASLRSPASNSKTPAWTTQDSLAFAGTEARHPGAPRSSNSQQSLNGYESDSSSASSQNIQPISTFQSTSGGTPPRLRRGAVTYDEQMDQVVSELRARHGNDNLTTDIPERPPSYVQSFRPPPNFSNETLPSYQQALTNAAYLQELSKRRNRIRRTTL